MTKTAIKLLISFFVLFLVLIVYVGLSASDQTLDEGNVREVGPPSALTSMAPEDFLPILNDFVPDYKAPPNFDDWDWKKDLIFGDIFEVVSEKKVAYVNINLPDNQQFSNVIMPVKLSCEMSKTFMFSSVNKEYLDGKFNVFDKVQEGDHFYSYCLNETCTEIGNLCVIIRSNAGL